MQAPSPPLPRDLPPALRALVARGAALVAPRTAADRNVAPRPVRELCDQALARPIGAPRLSTLATEASRVVVIVSDATRDEPREAMFDAVRRELAHVPDANITLMVGGGTHAPRPADTVLGEATRGRHPVVIHDGADASLTVDLGTTAEGTRVRIHQLVADADLVITTGRIRPHYFAGFSGGAKGIFPGCGHSVDIRQNHLLKADPSARLGRLDDNRCRLDIEDAASRTRGARYLINVVADCDGEYVAAFAGDIVTAHRAACAAAEPYFRATGPRADIVVTSDLPPVTDSLYQASKLLPPAGALLRDGGTAIVLAPCPEGIGPLQTVNEGIYRLGIRHHLPEGHRILLVSDMDEATASTSYATPAPSLEAALARAGAPPTGPLSGLVTVTWRAGELIASPTPA